VAQPRPKKPGPETSLIVVLVLFFAVILYLYFMNLGAPATGPRILE
jgi:hypothetical protein